MWPELRGDSGRSGTFSVSFPVDRSAFARLRDALERAPLTPGVWVDLRERSITG